VSVADLYAAKVLADSITAWGERLTTFEVTFPRIVLAEVNTHTILSRNSASSRAIPVEKRIAALEAGGSFVPSSFGKNQKGMQASEQLDDVATIAAAAAWDAARIDAITHARTLAGLGVHKQLANRVIEPYCWHTAIISATEYENFFALRAHKDAQPEFRVAAEIMLDLYKHGNPRQLGDGEWHLPLIQPSEHDELVAAGIDPCKVSIGRCCRVSYLTHDGKRDPQADVELCERITKAGHMSPLQHAARPMNKFERRLFERPEYLWDDEVSAWRATGRAHHFLGNYDGWVQYRKLIPGEAVFRG
jgi:thymidylate synthase ThyX